MNARAPEAKLPMHPACAVLVAQALAAVLASFNSDARELPVCCLAITRPPASPTGVPIDGTVSTGSMQAH